MASGCKFTESIAEGSDEIRQLIEDSHHALSDEYHEVTCSPCEKDGKNVSAEIYCVDCNQDLCQLCLKQHEKFDSMKSHQLVEDYVKAGEDRGKGRLDLPSQRCVTHHGRLLDVYCRSHNQVCCGTCVSINHSSCVGLSYIPQTAKVTDVLQKSSDKLKKIRKQQSLTESLLEARRVQLASVKKEKDRISEEITGTCAKIIDHFKKLEKNDLKKLDCKVSCIATELQVKINRTEDVLSNLKREKHLLEKYLSEDNTSSLFVQFKLVDQCVSDCSDILNQPEPSGTAGFEFSFNQKAYDLLTDIQTIGDISEYKTIASFTLHGDFDVKAPDDALSCDITDIALHEDGTLFMTDYTNKSLKRINSQYRVDKSQSLPGKPNSVCFTGRCTVAVALTDTNVVQFVSIKENMSLSSSFKVSDHCRGIAYKDGCFYVTCGGRYKYGEGPGRLEVYSCSGKHLKTYDADMSVPKQILKHKYGQLFHITDSYKGLIVMTTDGRIQKRLVFKDIDTPIGICSGPGIQCFLCGMNSHNIVFLSGNDKPLHVLRPDGVQRPQALCFDQDQSRLIIAMDTTNTIKVLNLSFE